MLKVALQPDENGPRVSLGNVTIASYSLGIGSSICARPMAIMRAASLGLVRQASD